MIIQSWLEQVCLMIPNVQGAIVIEYEDASMDQQTVASWPNKSFDCDSLLTSLPLLKAQLSPVVKMGKQALTDHDTLIIAYPLALSSPLSTAVIVEVAAKVTQQAVLLQVLKWSQGWLQLLLKHANTNHANSDHLQCEKPVTINGQDCHDQVSPASLHYLSIIAAVLSCSKPQQAYMTIVNEVLRAWPFARVSLGIIGRNEITVKAVSHSAHFDSRSNLIVSLQQAMAEVQDKTQGQYFVAADAVQYHDYPQHQGLLSNEQCTALVSLPLQENQQTVAVLLCELPSTEAQQVTKYLAELTLIAGLLGSLVALQQQLNQSISERIVAGSRSYLAQLNQGRFGKLPFVGGFFLLLLMTLFIDSDFRVASAATLEGRIQRAVVAPFDGYIETAFARAGEQVEQGKVLAQLDDRPLQLEKRAWLSKKEEYEKQYRQELASLSHAKARIIKAQIAQAEVQIEQAQSRLQRAQLVSPLEGIIIEGDLSRSLGAPVEQGQVLFEIAPLNDYRVVLKIHERDIAYLQKGQQGSLLLTAYPHQSITVTIDQVAIVYEQEGDYTWYRTEATLAYDELPSDILLRPGMEGLGKIEVGQKSLAWIGLHRLTDWLRLWFWSWTP